MFGFSKKCTCGDARVVWTEVVVTIGGNLDIHYCQKCVDAKMEEERKRSEENERKRKENEIEKEKNDYYLWLKREVEIKELEAKAKELGILPKKG